MGAAFSWLLALRYLASRWVNVLGVLGVAVAVWALIVVPSVFAGFIGDIQDEVRNTSPDLLVTSLPADAGYEPLRAALAGDPDVLALAPRLRHYGVVYPRTGGSDRQWSTDVDFSNASTNYVQLLGIDRASEEKVTALSRWLAAAAGPRVPPTQRAPELDAELRVPGALERKARRDLGLPVTDEPWRALWPGMLLSDRRLASMPSLRAGYPLDLVAVAWTPEGARADGAAAVTTLKRTFAFAGAYHTGGRLFDEVTALVSIEPLRELLGHSALDPSSIDLVTDVAIRSTPGLTDEQLDRVAERLRQRARAVLGSDSKVEVLSWRRQNQVILDAVDLERSMTTLVLFLVMLIAAFLIYATLHMMVTQKIKDIGILTALGGAPGAVGAVFTRCGLVIGTLGAGLGTAAGITSVLQLNPVNDWLSANYGIALFDHRLYDLPEIPYRLEPLWIAQVAVAALAMTLFVAWLPARKAARLHPVKTLAYE